MHKSAKLSDFRIYKLNKATNDTVLTLQLFVNACSPEGATKLSSTFSALYQFCLLITLIRMLFTLNVLTF